jgi:hypothetical protein
MYNMKDPNISDVKRYLEITSNKLDELSKIGASLDNGCESDAILLVYASLRSLHLALESLTTVVDKNVKVW